MTGVLMREMGDRWPCDKEAEVGLMRLRAAEPQNREEARESSGLQPSQGAHPADPLVSDSHGRDQSLVCRPPSLGYDLWQPWRGPVRSACPPSFRALSQFTPTQSPADRAHGPHWLCTLFTWVPDREHSAGP